jgi:hypothetical protein
MQCSPHAALSLIAFNISCMQEISLEMGLKLRIYIIVRYCLGGFYVI